jgi:hypothetical protein
VAIAAASERGANVVLIMTGSAHVMRSRFLIAYSRSLLSVTTNTSLNGRLALVRLVALEAIGVTVVLLGRVTIDAIAYGL